MAIKRDGSIDTSIGRGFRVKNMDVAFDSSVPDSTKKRFLQASSSPQSTGPAPTWDDMSKQFQNRPNNADFGGGRPSVSRARQMLTRESNPEMGWKQRSALNGQILRNQQGSEDNRVKLQEQDMRNESAMATTKESNSGALARQSLSDNNALDRTKLTEIGADNREIRRNKFDLLKGNIDHQYDINKLDVGQEYNRENSQIGAIEKRSSQAYQRAKDLVSVTPKTKIDDRKTILDPKSGKEIANPGFGIDEIRNSAFDDAYSNYLNIYNGGSAEKGADGVYTNQPTTPDFHRSVVAPTVREGLARKPFVPDVNGVFTNDQQQVAAPQQRSVAPLQYRDGGNVIQGPGGVYSNPTMGQGQQVIQQPQSPQLNFAGPGNNRPALRPYYGDHQAIREPGNIVTDYTPPAGTAQPVNDPNQYVAETLAAPRTPQAAPDPTQAPVNNNTIVGRASTRQADAKLYGPDRGKRVGGNWEQTAPQPPMVQPQQVQQPPAIPPGVSARKGLGPNDMTPIYTSSAQDALNNGIGWLADNSPQAAVARTFASGAQGLNDIRKSVLDRLRRDSLRNKEAVSQ